MKRTRRMGFISRVVHARLQDLALADLQTVHEDRTNVQRVRFHFVGGSAGLQLQNTVFSQYLSDIPVT